MLSYGFDAVLALVGEESRDGRMLLHPADGDIPVGGGGFPLPVLGLAGGEGPPPLIGHLHYFLTEDTAHGKALVARGTFNEGCEVARDYVGALALGLARLALDAGSQPGGFSNPTVAPSSGGKREGRLLHVAGWAVLGATVVEEHAWDVPPVKVYEVPATR